MNILKLLFTFSFLLVNLNLTLAQEKKEDWAKFHRYEQANKTVTKTPFAVLMGNSITDAWPKKSPSFFADNNFVGRGISGQTSSEMLVRFRADVIELKPQVVVICAGTNDVAQNNGVISQAHIMDNIISMVELARYNDITPVLCSVLPADRFYWNKAIQNPAPLIMELNTQIKSYAKQHNIMYIDYHTAMRNEDGAMLESYTKDGVHPTLEGYQVMEKVLLSGLKQVK